MLGSKDHRHDITRGRSHDLGHVRVEGITVLVEEPVNLVLDLFCFIELILKQ